MRLAVVFVLVSLVLCLCSPIAADARRHHSSPPRSDRHYMSLIRLLVEDPHFHAFVERNEVAQERLASLLPERSSYEDEDEAFADSTDFSDVVSGPRCMNPSHVSQAMKKMQTDIVSKIQALVAQRKAGRRSEDATSDEADYADEYALTDEADGGVPFGALDKVGHIAGKIAMLPVKAAGAIVGGAVTVVGGAIFISAVLMNDLVASAICHTAEFLELDSWKNTDCSRWGKFNWN